MDKTEEQQQPLIDHLIELRTRLIWACVALAVAVGFCYIFKRNIFDFLIAPLGDGRKLIYTGMAEGFFTYLKVSFFAGFILSFPAIAWQAWKFIAPALYEKEKTAFIPFVIAAPILFLLGASLAYYGVIPAAWKFFMSFEQTGIQGDRLPIVLEPRVAEYLSLTMTMIIAFGLAFQLPIILMLLGRAGLIDAATLHKKRKYMFLAAFVVGAILTPPDIISQTCLSIPLYLLYEISIVLVKWGEMRRAEKKITLSDITAKDVHKFWKKTLRFAKHFQTFLVLVFNLLKTGAIRAKPYIIRIYDAVVKSVKSVKKNRKSK